MTQGYHPNEAENMRLDHIIVDLRRKGYRQITIAKALGIGARTVSAHLSRAGFAPQRAQYRDPAHLPPLESIEWRDPVEATGNGETMAVNYRISLPARAVSNQLRHLQQINGVVRLAFDVTHALEAGDEDWVAGVRADLDQTAEYVRRLIAVVDDEGSRQRARTDHGERDDINPPPPPTLRSVAG